MSKEYAKRFPTDTSLEVYTPENPPPGAGTFLKLDQTTPETVSGGSPHFDGGITIKAGQRLVFDGS